MGSTQPVHTAGHSVFCFLCQNLTFQPTKPFFFYVYLLFVPQWQPSRGFPSARRTAAKCTWALRLKLKLPFLSAGKGERKRKKEAVRSKEGGHQQRQTLINGHNMAKYFGLFPKCVKVRNKDSWDVNK